MQNFLAIQRLNCIFTDSFVPNFEKKVTHYLCSIIPNKNRQTFSEKQSNNERLAHLFSALELDTFTDLFCFFLPFKKISDYLRSG